MLKPDMRMSAPNTIQILDACVSAVPNNSAFSH
jgi:hypothetical protein